MPITESNDLIIIETIETSELFESMKKIKIPVEQHKTYLLLLHIMSGGSLSTSHSAKTCCSGVSMCTFITLIYYYTNEIRTSCSVDVDKFSGARYF